MFNVNHPKSSSKPNEGFRDKFQNFNPFSNRSKNKNPTSGSSQQTGQHIDDTYDNIDLPVKPKDSPQMATRTYQPKQDELEKQKKLIFLEEKSRNLQNRHSLCHFYSEKRWLELQYDRKTGQILKPQELEDLMVQPPVSTDPKLLDQIQGSIIGMALGDALGAHVEFRPRQYLLANPVTDLVGGGTWGLAKGQFTDDTSMALCLANSLLARKDFCPYDQLVRYKWWYHFGYMSSTGECFDIGNATRESIDKFNQRQMRFVNKRHIPNTDIDYLSDPEMLSNFNIYCSSQGVAGNGALMRLAPVPLFFFRYPQIAVEYSGISGQITHGDIKAYDACRYYGALIVAALRGCSKKELLDKKFYETYVHWFGGKPLCSEILLIATGSFKKKKGYKDGIRGKGYIVAALEAALWAFWSDNDSFEQGALNAVNLGDDTDTTAAIYGQLAGTYYGYKNLPPRWLKYVHAHRFMLNLSEWIGYEGQNWQQSKSGSSSHGAASSDSAANGSYNLEAARSAQSKQPDSKSIGNSNKNVSNDTYRSQEAPLTSNSHEESNNTSDYCVNAQRGESAKRDGTLSKQNKKQ